MAGRDAVGGSPFDLAGAEAITERIADEAERTWALLLEAHDRRAWSAMGHESWDAYLAARFDPTRSDAFRLVERAHVLPEGDAAESEVALSGSDAQTLVDQVVLSLEALTMGLDLVDLTTLPEDAHAARVVREALTTFERLRDALTPGGPPGAGGD